MATATGIFQYDDGEDLVEGTVLGHGQTPQVAVEDVQEQLKKESIRLAGFSVTEIVPGNPYGLPTLTN